MARRYLFMGLAVLTGAFFTLPVRAFGPGSRSLSEAILWADEAALHAVGGGQVTTLTVDGQGAKAVWQVGVSRQGMTYHVLVSRQTNQVLAVKPVLPSRTPQFEGGLTRE
ncbi:MAG: PepSY domain-containing protein [Sulfobacillus sp.]|nr:PepSY domain-containing protein [Sulfobacillus sp.]